MSPGRKRIEHDHSRGVIVSALQTSLFQQGETQTQARFNVMRILVEEVTKDLFSLLVVAFAHRAVALVVGLLVGGDCDSASRAGESKTKHEGDYEQAEKIFRD